MVRVRGHTLLCLQGFRGEGYSPAFIETMREVHRQLFRDLGTPVTVIEEPDHFCRACPNLSGAGCVLNGPGSEAERVAQDRRVLALLGLESGGTYPWGEILRRIYQAIDPERLDEICGACRWLALGYCEEGIRQLKETLSETRGGL